MDEQLVDLIKRSKPTFRPHAIYIESADCLQVYIHPGHAVGRRVDEIMTFYEDPETGALTGCMVKGVARLSDALGDFRVDVCEGGTVRISMVFLAYHLLKTPGGWPEDLRERFRQLVKESADLVAERAAA